jgi:hypothetical protein
LCKQCRRAFVIAIRDHDGVEPARIDVGEIAGVGLERIDDHVAAVARDEPCVEEHRAVGLPARPRRDAGHDRRLHQRALAISSAASRAVAAASRSLAEP